MRSSNRLRIRTGYLLSGFGLAVVVAGGIVAARAGDSSRVSVTPVETTAVSLPCIPDVDCGLPQGSVPVPATLAPLALDPAIVATATEALRSDPAVAKAVGADYEIVSTEGSFKGPEMTGAVFLIHTPAPVTLPVGTLSSVGSVEGVEPDPKYAPITEAIGPLSYFYVLPVEGVGHVFLPVPDELASYKTGAEGGS